MKEGMHDILILDGGMGRELKKTGAPFKQPEWSALALMQTPELVSDAHKRFLKPVPALLPLTPMRLYLFILGKIHLGSRLLLWLRVRPNSLEAQ